MSFLIAHWLGKLAGSRPVRGRRLSPRPRLGVRLEAEQLEGRCLPSLITVATFNGANGSEPCGGLVLDSSGNLFGTTQSGTSNGSLFEVQKGSGTITTLAVFDGSDGTTSGTSPSPPQDNLVLDSSGNLFGTATKGGANDYGTVFELPSGSGAITALASFNGSNGAYPLGGLVQDSSGNLFATTNQGGGSSVGKVVEIQHGTSTITSRGPFNGSGNGQSPTCPPTVDSSGNLFGATLYGGANDYGAIWEVPSGSSGMTAITALYSFSSSTGQYPNCTLALDSAGDLFGTTTSGGDNNDGTIFELKHGASSITTLASFNGSNGYFPTGNLVMDSSGNLFGTTVNGGATWVSGGAPGYGTVFELPAGSGTISVLASFSNSSGGYYPYGGVFRDKSGNLFGTTSVGGDMNNGAVFEVTAPTGPVITTTSLANWTANTPGYSQTIQATGGVGSLSFTATGTLPVGLTLSKGGVLSGTPTTAGSYTFTVTATDTTGASGSQTYTVAIAPAIAFQVSAPASVTAGKGFLLTVQAESPISGYSGEVNLTTTDPQVPTLPPLKLTNGLGYCLVTFGPAAGGPWTITASNGSYAGTSAAISVNPGPAVKLAFAAQPVATPTGDLLPAVTVQVEDPLGNRITGDNSDTVTLGIASRPGGGGFAAGSTLSALVHNGVATFSNLTFTVPGTYQLSELVPGRYTGPNSAAFAVLPLQVLPGSFVDTPSGFSLGFNAPYLVNSVTPALYGTGFGASAPVPSVTLTQIADAYGNPITPVTVEGSVLLSPATSSLTFLATNTASQNTNGTPILPDGTYEVEVLSSGPTGWQGKLAGGGYLDGLGSGTPASGDFTTTFTISAAAAGDEILWLPDTADGPLQPLEAPGANQSGGGYPFYVNVNPSGSDPITDVQVTMTYNPALLTVMSTSTAINGGTFSVTASAGSAVLHWSGSSLPVSVGTPLAVGFVTATVPNSSASSPIYRAKDLLHLSSPSINAGEYPVTTGDGLHLVAYVGDANGDGTYSSADAVLINHVGLQTDTGFAAYPLVDPVIVADTDGSGFVPADAPLQVNEAGVGFPTANLPNPPIPAGANTTPVSNNVDPTLSLAVRDQGSGDSNAGTVDVAVNIDDAHPAGSSGLIEGHLALTYNPRLFSVFAADVHPGSLLAGGGWSITPTIDAATGQIAIALSSSTPIASALGGSLVTIDFHQINGEPGASATGVVTLPTPVADAPGSPAIALVPSVDIDGQVIATELEDAQGTFLLTLGSGKPF